jgi:hypothetical protein
VVDDINAPAGASEGGTGAHDREADQASRVSQADLAKARLDKDQAEALTEPGAWRGYKAQQRGVKQQRKRDEQVKRETRVPKPRATSGEETFALVLKLASKTLTPVEEPVALICQAPRSGGTLLRHLFDGHPECHVHPYEWHIGPRKTRWPQLGQDEPPERWWVKLREDALADRFTTGIKVDQTKYRGPGSDRLRVQPYAMMLPPLLHREIFLHQISKLEGTHTDRTILNAYLTGLFNGWLNNHTLDDADKRWVVAFAPRLAWGSDLEAFFHVYPEGALISVLRDPYGWFNSSRGRQPDFKNDARLLALWTEGAHEMIRAKNLYPDRVTIVSFDDLVHDTAGVMKLLAKKLGIAYDELMTRPTFNSRAIGANSSYIVGGTEGVTSDPLERWKRMLSEEDQLTIGMACTQLFERVLGLVEHPGGKPRVLERMAPGR